jgi:hypothetical protein
MSVTVWVNITTEDGELLERVHVSAEQAGADQRINALNLARRVLSVLERERGFEVTESE